MSRPDTDSPATAASIDAASARLAAALDALEARVPVLIDTLSRNRTQLSESSGMASDRAQLAARLDDTTARLQELERERDRLRGEASERDARIQSLSERTRAELDGTIATLRDVLGG